MTSALWAKGTQLLRAGTAIAELNNIPGPAMTADAIEATNHGTSGGWKEFLSGLKDGGELAIEGNFIPGDTNGQVQMAADFNAGTIVSWTVQNAANGFAWTFQGFVSKYQVVNELKAVHSLKATIRITGQPVLGITASSNLSAMTISVGTLSPAFVATSYEYDDVLTNGTTSVTVTATNATAQLIQLYVNGVLSQTLASGTASSAISTAVGMNNLQIVTKDANKAPVTYTIHASRSS